MLGFSFIYFHFSTLTAQGQSTTFSTVLRHPKEQNYILFFRPLNAGILPQAHAISYWTFEKNVQSSAVCAKLARNGYSGAVLINHTRETRFIFSCNRRSPVPFCFPAAFFSLCDSGSEDRAMGFTERCWHRSAPAGRSPDRSRFAAACNPLTEGPTVPAAWSVFNPCFSCKGIVSAAKWRDASHV